MTRDVLRALGRRWYIVVTGLLMTVALALGAYHITPPNYTASGLILLLPSKTQIGPGGNPFLALSDLDQPAGILVAYFSGASAQADVKAQYRTAQYTVQISSSARGPIIEVDVTDKTSAGTLGALDYITSQIPEELHRLQAAVAAPANAIITSMPLTIDGKAKADYSGTIRMVITATLIGLLVTGVVTFAVDGLLASRRARRQAKAEKEGAAAAAAHAPAPPAPPTPHRTPWRRPAAGRQSPPADVRDAQEPAPAHEPNDVHDQPGTAHEPAAAHEPATARDRSAEMVSQLSGRVPADTGREH
ncbi:hypothetical protein [Leifsonia shinshuensis]